MSLTVACLTHSFGARPARAACGFRGALAEYEPPIREYTIELRGDQADLSANENRCVLARTAPAMIRIAKNPASALDDGKARERVGP